MPFLVRYVIWPGRPAHASPAARSAESVLASPATPASIVWLLATLTAAKPSCRRSAAVDGGASNS